MRITALMPSPPEMARRLIGLVDLTTLNESDDDATVRELARWSHTAAGRVAAFCTWTRLVPAARQALGEPAIKLAAVANFPEGAADAAAAAQETAEAIAAGADEVDLVFPYRALLGGRPESGLELVAACRRVCGERTLLKVILETGQLSRTQIRQAADIAVEGGAQFLKTSTGKTQPGATPEAAAVLLDAIAAAARRGRTVGLKVSGGIRSLAQAVEYLDLYERRFGEGSAQSTSFRIGASALLKELVSQAGPG